MLRFLYLFFSSPQNTNQFIQIPNELFTCALNLSISVYVTRDPNKLYTTILEEQTCGTLFTSTERLVR